MLEMFVKAEKQKSDLSHVICGEDFVSRSRVFDLPECRDCIYKGSSYCWGQCPYNVWKRETE